MARRWGSEKLEDRDYDPTDSQNEDKQTFGKRNSSDLQRSSRGRPVKMRHMSDESDTESEDMRPRSAAPSRSNSGYANYDNEYSRPSYPAKKTSSKRQRWVPHNPHLLGQADDDEDSKDIQISDDDESGDEGGSRLRRKVNESRIRGGSVPIRDETGKFVGVRPQTPAERRQASAAGARPGGGGIFKSAAVTVLREERRLMSTGDIARLALKRGYIKVQGRTPEATMASAMYTDVKRKEARSTFIRPHEGLFGLREWLEEGVAFLDPVQDKYPEEAMQSALRRSRAGHQHSGNSKGTVTASRSRSQASSPLYDGFTSQRQGPSSPGRDDISPGLANDLSGLPPRGSGSASAMASKAQPFIHRAFSSDTPFGSNRGGPSLEIFKPKAGPLDGTRGFAPTTSGRRTSSNPLIFQKAHSSGRRQHSRKLGLPNMSPQDSGNMLLLLNAAELETAQPSKPSPQKPLPGHNERLLVPMEAVKQDNSAESTKELDLAIQGFGTGRVVQGGGVKEDNHASSSGASSEQRVNIMNLPLPDYDLQEGHMNGEEVKPNDGEADLLASQGKASIDPLIPPQHAEDVLQQLDSAFAMAPLASTGSLTGPLAPTISVPPEAPLNLLARRPPALQEQSAETGNAAGVPASSNTMQAPSAPLTSSALLPGARMPGSAFQMTGAPQMPTGGGMPNFGPPEQWVDRIGEVEAAIARMESTLGPRHAKVGKGYLYLSRVHQCRATSESYQKAQQALQHAYEICFAVSHVPNAKPS